MPRNIEPMTVSEAIAGGSRYSDMPDLIYGLSYDLDQARGFDPADEIDRYGHMAIDEFLSQCRACGLDRLPVHRLVEALAEREVYFNELADEAAYDRAHGYY